MRTTDEFQFMLANPAWHALITRQQHFNTGSVGLRYFPADISPFVGLPRWDNEDLLLLSRDLPANRSFYVLLEKQVNIPVEFEIKFSLPLYQMECGKLHTEYTAFQVKELGETHLSRMLELTALTRPGPFYNKTISLGHYIGIFENEKLIAMGGERLKVPGFTEVSAICTHPDHQGKHLAGHIISLLAQRIFDRGETPFLHTRTDNQRAIRLYEKLGFSVSRDIFFAVITRK